MTTREEKSMDRHAAASKNKIAREKKAGYVQKALDQVREDILELKSNLDSDNGGWALFCVDKKDLLDRVESWQFNTWRRMEDILRGGEG